MSRKSSFPSPSTLGRSVAVLCAITFSFSTFQGMCQAITPLLLNHLALSKTVIGLLQAVPGLATIALGALLARLANTRWRREVLTGGFALNIIACLLYAGASRAADFILPQLLFGVSSTAFWSNMLVTSFRLAQGEEQQRIQGTVTTLQGLGFFAGPMLGGYLSGFSYAYGFYAGAACAAIGLASSLWLDRATPIEPYPGLWPAARESYARLWRVMTRRPVVMVGMAFVFMNCFLLYVMGGSFYLLYAQQLGLTTFMAAALISGRDAVSALVRLGFGWYVRRIPVVTLLGAGTMLGALCLGLMPFISSTLALAAMGIGAGVCLACLPPAVNLLSGASAAPEEQSFAMVSMHLSNFAAQTTLAPLMGLALTRWSYATSYPVISALWVLLAALAWRVGLRLTTQPARAALAPSAAE